MRFVISDPRHMDPGSALTMQLAYPGDRVTRYEKEIGGETVAWKALSSTKLFHMVQNLSPTLSFSMQAKSCRRCLFCRWPTTHYPGQWNRTFVDAGVYLTIKSKGFHKQFVGCSPLIYRALLKIITSILRYPRYGHCIEHIRFCGWYV